MPDTLTPTFPPGQAARESSPVLAVVEVTAKPGTRHGSSVN